jgi:cell division septation protein DedD
MATTTSDDAFHEIQLNGKQLVFLFMAVVVASVVIFLLGVLVGRGVRAERGPVEALAQPAAPATEGIIAAPAPGGAPASVGKEDLSYPNRLASANPPAETLPTPRPDAADVPASASARAQLPPSSGETSPKRPVIQSREGGPASDGFAIQVAALRQRGEAESVARGLTTKGYPAYVMNPDAGAPAVFRVRVGKFKDRREAESIAARLQKEEQFKPWIVR